MGKTRNLLWISLIITLLVSMGTVSLLLSSGMPETVLSVEPPTIIDETLTPQPTTTIRPVADGTLTAWTGSYIDWDETVQNGDTDYVSATSYMLAESSELEDPVHQSWDIARVRVVAYARTDIATDEELVFVLVIGGEKYWADWPNWPYAGYTLTTTYEKYSWDWGKNPHTGEYWTWSDIDALEAGVESQVSLDYVWTGEMRVTQLYVEVEGPRFAVDVEVSNVEDLWGYKFMLSYDTTILTATSYTSYDPFTFPWPSEINDEISTVTGEEVGTGDGETTDFLLAYRPVIIGSDTVYLDEVEQTRDVDYTIDYKAGEITFTTAPDVEVAITADYQYAAYVSVSYSKPPAEPGESGSMPLMQIGFLVDALGQSDLDLHDTGLSDPPGEIILHDVVDGYFSNIPVVEVGWIEGTVTDDAMVPLEGATVSTDAVSDVTDSLGFYSLEVSPGTYDVTASMMGYESQTVTGISVSADETVTQDFALTPIVEVGWIEGTVTDDAMVPLEGATVSTDAVSDVTDSLGFYSLEVSPGTYDVTATMTGYESQTVTGVSVAADATVVQDFALVPVVVDITPPTITINEPVAKDYLHSETMTLDFSAEDPSGVASVTAMLDGESVMSGDEIELYTLSLGSYMLTVTAVDNVGNSGTETVTFNVIATVGSLQDLVYMFFESGYFHSAKGMYTSLIQKLYAAEAYISAGQIDDAKGVLGAFINHLEAQSGKHVDAYAANVLIADAQYVIDKL